MVPLDPESRAVPDPAAPDRALDRAELRSALDAALASVAEWVASQIGASQPA